jgi:hypothetical protein
LPYKLPKAAPILHKDSRYFLWPVDGGVAVIIRLVLLSALLLLPAAVLPALAIAGQYRQ